MAKDIWWASLLGNSSGQWSDWQMFSLIKHISGWAYEVVSKDSRPVGHQLRVTGLAGMWAAPIMSWELSKGKEEASSTAALSVTMRWAASSTTHRAALTSWSHAPGWRAREPQAALLKPRLRVNSNSFTVYPQVFVTDKRQTSTTTSQNSVLGWSSWDTLTSGLNLELGRRCWG